MPAPAVRERWGVRPPSTGRADFSVLKARPTGNTHGSNALRLSTQQRAAVAEVIGEPGPPAQAPLPAEAVEDAETAVPDTSTPALATTAPREPPRTKRVVGFDTHYHLDRLQLVAHQPGIMTTGRGPNHPFPITGAVLNFCNPERWQEGSIEKAAIYTPAQWDGFLRLLCNPRVSAISEVGFDFSALKHLWCPQEELFNRILSLGTLGRILVMYLRGAAADLCGSTVNRLAIRLLKKKYLAHQRVHLHSFSGDAGMVRAWVAAFPHCYFGVLGLIQSFNRDQLQSVREIHLTRLLLETDSPHLKLHAECQYNTPVYLGDVGQHMARVRGMALPDVMQTTYANAVHLYA
ncbi:uncharacterized metal-dependent hydrolase YcfH-like [Diadema antillarum]|uniref:uncharacterized metal-dependent hydrolase YcfH-like n=1 Tax=Diadema antillarum TaxID=105358 RepID=UPI003A86ABD1